MVIEKEMCRHHSFLFAQYTMNTFASPDMDHGRII